MTLSDENALIGTGDDSSADICGSPHLVSETGFDMGCFIKKRKKTRVVFYKTTTLHVVQAIFATT